MKTSKSKSSILSSFRLTRGTGSKSFSLQGLLFLILTLFIALSAVNTQANLLFGVLGLMIGVLIVSFNISRLVFARLEVARILPEHGVVGRQLTLIYELSNKKKFWPSFSVTLAEEDSESSFVKKPLVYMLHAAPKMKAVVATEVIPRRRGLIELNHYSISTSFPFGFIRRTSIRQQKDALLIYPAIGQVDAKLLQRFKAAEKHGSMLRSERGGDDEFYGVKEFRAGENPRWIYWKRSAHTGVLVSKEMTRVSPPRLYLLIDTFMAEDKPEIKSKIEQTIAMAASVASAALEAGIMIGVHASNGNAFVRLTPNRGKRHFREVMTLLATLPENRTLDSDQLLSNINEFATGGTTCVVFTPNETESSKLPVRRSSLLTLSPDCALAKATIAFGPGIRF